VEIEELDLFNVDLPPYTGKTADAKYIMMAGEALDEATQEAWERITATTTHFLSFDIYLVSTPMWNFGIPYQLKHYIDVLVQAGFCFQFTETGPVGLATGKKMICITSRGSDYSKGSPIEALDFQEPYLRAIFGFIGIEDITFINAQPLDITPEITTAKIQEAKDAAKQLAQSLA
jgi:FMN-dependent NADH-azoreductase